MKKKTTLLSKDTHLMIQKSYCNNLALRGGWTLTIIVNKWLVRFSWSGE